MDGQMEDAKRKRFLWGVLLAWIPFLFLMLPTIAGFIRVFDHKATGIAAVAAGFAENFLNFGLFAVLFFEVSAIVLLMSAFSQGHTVRALFSLLSIICSGFMIAVLALFCWFFFRLLHF